MRLLLLTAVAMVAFAGNSVLNRMAVGSGSIGAEAFAVIRLCAGAGVLALLVGARHLRSGAPVWAGRQGRLAGVAGLLVYLFGFSSAYRSLDAGLGALILFGSVQITMFAGAVMAREAIPVRRWQGAGLAFGGLVLLAAPGGGAVPGVPALLMAGAGAGWGVYSLAGRKARDALGATAANFVLAVPVALVVATQVPMGAEVGGIALAILSGGVTSGLGYALWYTVLPDLGAARAAVAQLTVPLIAATGGVLIIGEPVGWRFAVAAALVLGGVAVAARAGR